MTPNRRASFLVLAAALALNACDAVTGGASGNPVGIGNIVARTKGTGFTAAPTFTFYRVTGATFVSSQTVRDTCFATAFNPNATPGVSTAQQIGAGAFVSIVTGTRTDSLVRTTGATDQTYRSALASGIPFTPGDSIVITTKGERNGFPTSTFRGKTAEPFTINPVTVPAAGDPIVVTWTAATAPGSAMFVNFHYAVSGSATMNRQIACTFVDDGSALVPGSLTTDWVNSAVRDYTGQRVRTILEQVDVPLSYFNVVSSFHWPTPASP
jgi:hypothetical protein